MIFTRQNSMVKTGPDLIAEIRFQKVELQTSRLTLKIFDEFFLSDRYVAWFNDPVVCQFNRHGSGYTKENAKSYLDFLKKSSDTLVFAISLKTGAHIGNSSINDIDWQKKSGEISILIGEKNEWGKAYGTEAVRCLINFAFQNLDLQRVWVGFTTNNLGMRRIAWSLNFKHFNTLPKGFKKEDSPPVDIEEWELLKQ